MDPRNAWLWHARVTHWVFKRTGDGSSWRAIAPCMDPYFDGAIPPEEAARQARALRELGVNLLFSEGLRRVMRFEAEGRTAQVAAALCMASDACHREGMRLVHHTTASFAGQTIEELPESWRGWLSVDAQTGQPAFEPLWGGWHLWCLNNPDFRETYFRLCRTLAAEAALDGFMVDEVYFRPNWHTCACPHCRAKFRKRAGFTLPGPDTESFWGNFANPAFRAWVDFRCASVGDFYQDLHKALLAAHPHPVLLGCKSAETLEGAQHFGDSARERMRGINTLFIELTASTTSLLHSWRYISANLKLYASLSHSYGTPTVAVLYHRAGERFLAWALRRAHGIRVKATASPQRLGEVLAPDNHILNFPEDCQAFRAWFAWEERHAGALEGDAAPLANIGLVMSEFSRDLFHHGLHMDYAREFMGWAERLTDAGLQYTFLQDMELTRERLQDLALVILPNVLCLSQRACRALLDYVANGGGLVLTHRTGERNLDGSQQADVQRLTRLLGLRQPAADTAAAGASAVEFGTLGKGRWAYFPHRPGPAAFETINATGTPRRHDDPAAPAWTDRDRALQAGLMLEAVRWTLAAPPPLVVEPLPRGLLVQAFRQAATGDVVIHLLNCRGENAVAFGERIPREYDVAFPALETDLTLSLRLPEAREACAFSPDWDGRRPLELRSADDGGVQSLTLPREALQRYTVVHIAVRH